jgi:hypothetical protein
MLHRSGTGAPGGTVESRTMLRFAPVLAAAMVAAVFSASAAFADVPFPPPSGWSHSGAPASTDPNHEFDQWHIPGDVATVTFIKDRTTAYADALATIEKNFSANNIKPNTDKDVPCQGKTAHVIEFAAGPAGKKIVINRMLVPDGPGVDTITYARSEGTSFDSDVQKSESTFCGSSS